MIFYKDKSYPILALVPEIHPGSSGSRFFTDNLDSLVPEFLSFSFTYGSKVLLVLGIGSLSLVPKLSRFL
jgi:hypothetical protein